jgi:ATP-dependent Clp protease ATP-binding subunit ClpC
MTESNLVQLKIIVERAVRPVRASITCKRKMREELLAHVSGAFEDEMARVQDEHAALERTRVRIGNPTEMANGLQDSVRISDRVRRFWEGRPGESALRFALRYPNWCSCCRCL